MAKAIITRNMQPTTPIKPAVKSSTLAEHWKLSLGFAALGALLLGVALPAAGARIIQLFAEDTHQSILNNKSVSHTELEKYIATRKQALALRETGVTQDDLAIALMLRAHANMVNAAVAQNDMKEATVWQTLSLARAPANAFGWMRLATLQAQSEGVSQLAAAALALSLETAPYEPTLSLPRLNLAMMLYGELSADTKERIPSLVRAAWENEPEQLAETAERDHYVSVVEQAIMNDKTALAAFRDLLPSKKKADEEAAAREVETGQDETENPSYAAEEEPGEQKPAVSKAKNKTRHPIEHRRKKLPTSEDETSE